ncbi:hypothetical protein Leryth_001625 [Lithospermum erythrorhizon]|nr:hypothetical protein Leryth_001625 [Lithospermum erythrorhizon]
MAIKSDYVKYIETYVESSSTQSQQAASVNEVASLVKKDLLMLETLVREMQMYLTTTDSIIRARGVLFLGELLMLLISKPLEDTVIHSLAGFFSDRLADWKALRGALVGCLALIRREADVGTVSSADAKSILQSYMQNLQVQSMGQHDRKLCFQLLEGLMSRYPGEVVPLGEAVLFGVCAAIDGEKDPQCLVLSFHIIKILGGLFLDSSGPLADIADELFELIGCYFPIHFTHPKSEDVEVKKEELSRELMMAFASTPLFEPFSMPLLLEKLSSSLPSAKIESFRYLSYCIPKYGAARVEKYAEVIWSSLKEVLYISPSTSLVEPDPTGGMGFQDSEMTTQALILLQEVVQIDNGPFLSKIIGDEDINTFLNGLTQFQNFSDIALEGKQKLHAISRILSFATKSSVSFCNKLCEKFFPQIMSVLGLSVEDPSKPYIPSSQVSFGAVYLCTELLDACRLLVLDMGKTIPLGDFADEQWCCVLQSSCISLYNLYASVLEASTADSTSNACVYSGVKGLQILAMFPEGFLPASKSYEDILQKLILIFTSNFDKTFLWNSILSALCEIGLFISGSHELEKTAIFERIVLYNMTSLLGSDDHDFPSDLNLQAIAKIGMIGQNFGLNLLQGLDKIIFAKLPEVYVSGNEKSIGLIIKILHCYSSELLPQINEAGSSEEVLVSFAANIWDIIGSSVVSNFDYQETELLGATMATMKNIVGKCSVRSQEMVIKKAVGLISSSNISPWMAATSDTTMLQPDQLNERYCYESFSYRDKWITSIFASVIVPLRPQTQIPSIRSILQFFVTTLHFGHVPSAYALGSLVNKLPLKTRMPEECSLEEALGIIFSNSIWNFCCNIDVKEGSADANSGIDINSLKLCTPSSLIVQVHAIVGLAWIGKGLLMRGHEAIKIVTIALMRCLLVDGNFDVEMLKDVGVDGKEHALVTLMRSAADAFQVLMSESEVCLNKKYHATVRPLYKQRFFNTVLPILLSSVQKTDSQTVRSMLYRAFAHVVSDAPFGAIMGEAQKLLPVLLDCLSVLSKDTANSDRVYDVLLVLSGILTDKNG